METRILSTNDPSAFDAALEVLCHGGVVAFPTDTVYGVGAHAFRPEAVRQLYVAKNRPAEKAIPLLIASADDLLLVAAEVSEIARRLAVHFWPGGLTLVVPRHPRVPGAVSSGPTVAVRVPDHPVPLALIAALGAPLAATSANLSGQPSPITAGQVDSQLRGRIALVLDGGPCPGGVPSTVVDVTVDPPVILRHEAISTETIRSVLQGLREGDSTTLGSLGFRRVEVLESPTCWGRGVMNPNKFGSPMCPPCKPPETHRSLSAVRRFVKKQM
jgi:L-threonylcarbamoyladenylate synthase